MLLLWQVYSSRDKFPLSAIKYKCYAVFNRLFWLFINFNAQRLHKYAVEVTIPRIIGYSDLAHEYST
ncbi:hypothetical protein S96127_1075 [Yersinia pestis]|nr:hypothetical protein S96127_1075 [Yersinia pestis]